MDVIDQILRLFAERGRDAYLGEPVSQREHALQTAWAAEKDGASPALVAAALLHDVGHLLHGYGDECADRGIDARHESIGHAWLARHFGPEVSEPVRLHVQAKRYLVAIDLDYAVSLSPASVHSLQLQGGRFSPSEVEAFGASPFAADAVRLRRWDDAAKVAGLPTPDLTHFRPYLDAVRRAE